jgi:transposase
MKYSQGFRNGVLQQVLPPFNRSVASVARERGISPGEWIRKHGLHTEHLTLWERELEGFVKNKDQDLKQENAQLKKELKELKKQAKRDKAAMAEALALLTLKKKADALLGQDEED